MASQVDRHGRLSRTRFGLITIGFLTLGALIGAKIHELRSSNEGIGIVSVQKRENPKDEIDQEKLKLAAIENDMVWLRNRIDFLHHERLVKAEKLENVKTRIRKKASEA